MGFAVKYLSTEERRRIASGLFDVKQSSGDELHGLCPFHAETRPSFSYNAGKDAYNCLSCGAAGDLVSLWAHTRGLDQKEGFLAFCREFNIEAGKDKTKGLKSGYKAKLKTSGEPQSGKFIPEEEWEKLSPLPEPWIERLTTQRGWKKETVEALALRLWINVKGEKRIAIPIRDGNGHLVNVRLYLPGGDPKVISWGKGYGASRLWPHPDTWKRKGPIWLCEGEPDTICALSQGLNACTQTAGAGTWKDSFSEYFKGREVIIAYDADEKGRKGAARAAKRLASVAELVRVIRWPAFMCQEDGSYPDDHGQDLTDFFVTHGKSVAALNDLLASAETVAPPETPEMPADVRRFFGGKNGRQFKSARVALAILQDLQVVSDPETSLIYRWTGKYWERWDLAYVRAKALEMLQDEATTSRAADVAAQVRDRSNLPADRKMNDRGEFICLRNGMFSLDTGDLLPHAPEYFASHMLGVDFQEFETMAKACPRWLQFLDETVQDPCTIDQVQEYFGYCLTRDVRYEKALLLIGPGSDGKSTMLSILQALVGEENCSAVAMDALEDQFQRASLVDKLLNVSTEVEGKAFASGWFKAVVSGDLISASFKHATPFEFAPFCKLAFAANKFPRVLDNSDGFFRRILPIRFKRQFPDDKADRRLREKLKAELSGIFWWSLGGLVRLQQMDGFTRSGDTDDVLHEYRQANNPVLCFVEECCHTEPGYEGQTLRVSRGEIYKAYREFCTKNGFVPFNRVHFGRELRTIVPKLRDIQIRQGDNRERFFEGIGLLSSL